MNEERPSFAEKLNSYLGIAEKVLVGLLCLGVLVRYANIDGKPLLTISLWGLAGIFFLSAFKPPAAVEPAENQKSGFMDSFILTMAPKLLGIGSAVATIGILFFFIGNEGYQPMLVLGGGIIGLVTLALGLALVIGTKNLSAFTPILMRAIPLLIIAVYVLLQHR